MRMQLATDLCLHTQTISRKTKPTAIPIMTPTATANSKPSDDISITRRQREYQAENHSHSSFSRLLISPVIFLRSSVIGGDAVNDQTAVGAPLRTVPPMPSLRYFVRCGAGQVGAEEAGVVVVDAV